MEAGGRDTKSSSDGGNGGFEVGATVLGGVSAMMSWVGRITV
jgi:hypothetical protein